jgi:hypothetical protein
VYVEGHDLKPEAVWQNSQFLAEIYKIFCLYVNNFLGATLVLQPE